MFHLLVHRSNLGLIKVNKFQLSKNKTKLINLLLKMDDSKSSNNNNHSLANNRSRKTWPQIKSVVEFSRKLIQSLNGDVPSNIHFRECLNKQTGQYENRVYFLASNQKREITIKYINLKQLSLEATHSDEKKIVGVPIFSNLTSFTNVEKQQLTKEEQLLRERKRCSFNGITSYSLDQNSNRLVFSERSELFYFDDANEEYNALDVFRNYNFFYKINLLKFYLFVD